MARRLTHPKSLLATALAAAAACTTLMAGTANAVPVPRPLCTITYPDPAQPTRAEHSVVTTAPSGTGSTTFKFHTLSTTRAAYNQDARVTWANLDTGLSGGGWDSTSSASVDLGYTQITLPVQTVGKGRITVVASVSNTAPNGWTSYYDCVSEYTAR